MDNLPCGDTHEDRVAIRKMAERLAEAERELKAAEQERDEVLSKFVQQSERKRAEAAEAKLAFLKSKGLTVAMAKDAGQPERLVYVIEDGSELCDSRTVSKLVDAEVKLEAAEAKVREVEKSRDEYKIAAEEEAAAGDEARAEVAQLQAKLAVVRSVLEWYGDANRYRYDETCCPYGPNPGAKTHGEDVLSDNGEKARDAIANIVREGERLVSPKEIGGDGLDNR